MASGIDAARKYGGDPTLSALLEDMRDQLVIVLIKRLLAGKPTTQLRIPVAEIDDTGQDLLLMALDQERGEFIFELRRKQ